MALIVESAEQFTDVASRTSHIFNQMKIENFAFPIGRRCSLSERRALEALGGKCMAQIRASLPVREYEFGTDDAVDAYFQTSEREKLDLQLYHEYEDIWHQFVNDSIRFDQELEARTLPPLAERPQKRSLPDLEQLRDKASPSDFLAQFLATPAPLMPVTFDPVAVHDAPVVSSQNEPPAAEIDTHSIETQPVAAPAVLLSEVLEEYFSYHKSQCGDDRVRGAGSLPLRFMVDLCGDRDIASYTTADFEKVENALPDVPLLKGVPKKYRKSMHSRYLYCLSVKKQNLQPVTKKTLRDNWHGSLQKFWAWAKRKNFIAGELYRFDLVPPHIAEATQRDIWTDDEARGLFQLPLFSGCKSDAQFWIEGNCLVQSELYWGYIFAFFLGLRSSEISKIKIENIVKKGDVTFIGLRSSRSQVRSFTPQPSDKTTLKTMSSERDVPIPDFFLELGLAARIEDLKQRGEKFLFPEWKTYRHKQTGVLMPGHHLSKSFQYIKSRKAVFGKTATLHGARHAVATRMDEAKIPERIRNQVLGHQPATIASGYGAKFLTEAEAQLFLGRNNALEQEVATLLLAARQKVETGEMRLITRVEKAPAAFKRHRVSVKKVRASKK